MAQFLELNNSIIDGGDWMGNRPRVRNRYLTPLYIYLARLIVPAVTCLLAFFDIVPPAAAAVVPLAC